MATPPEFIASPHLTRRGWIWHSVEMIHKGDSFWLEEDRLHATLIFERPI